MKKKHFFFGLMSLAALGLGATATGLISNAQVAYPIDTGVTVLKKVSEAQALSIVKGSFTSDADIYRVEGADDTFSIDGKVVDSFKFTHI